MKIGSDFSGVGAFEQALKRLKIDYNTVFACDLDKYARQTYLENNGEPGYFPENVYDRDIPAEPLDIYMTSPPCQAFSLAGKRKGEQDNRGVLFYNSHEFIKVNRPRYFIFENVKGLLSDDNGKTFQRWIDYLATSVNGQPVIFPHEESVMYHVYHRVLNSKDFGVPQNRERIFIIGIRDDKDNYFRFPKKEYLTKKLKDVLESEVDDKYYLELKKDEIILNKKSGNVEKVLSGGRWDKMQGGHREPKIIGYTRDEKGKVVKRHLNNVSNTIHSSTGGGGNTDQFVYKGAALRTRDDEKGKNKRLELRNDDLCNALTSHQTDSLVYNSKIRKLTPRECFRLQDFPDSFAWTCSDSQAYKQAGNSITVGVLEKLLNNLLYL